MFHRNILVSHPPGDLFRFVQRPVHALADIDLAGFPAPARHFGQLFHFGLNCGFKGRNGQSHFGQQLGNQSPLLLQQSQHQVGLFNLLIAIGLS